MGILFFDLEVNRLGNIVELGALVGEDALRSTSPAQMREFLNGHSDEIDFICGHNIIDFDDRYIALTSLVGLLEEVPRIDTLPLSLLLFSEKTFHALPKNYKKEDDFKNDPLQDAILSKTLYLKCVERFMDLDIYMQNLFYTLTKESGKFSAFYDSMPKTPEELSPILLKRIIARFYGKLITNEELLEKAISSHPVELAYILSLLTPLTEVRAHPPAILYAYPDIVKLHEGLTLGSDFDDIGAFSEEVFGFSGFREFPRLEASLEEGAFISQRDIVEAAMRGESFIAVLPTGGGKTFTFWLPALYRASRSRALTVVISPLQALMKDHIESFERDVANFSAVAISGYQTSIERQDAISKVVEGEADILYLAPESLRSGVIFSILKNRHIDRFVVDEAHCLSTWGHDFRHDYFYIANFISDLLRERPWQESIPVSCFTATAKPDVIEDITSYFSSSLGLDMKRYLALPERKNLLYDSLRVEKREQKYLKLLEILKEREGAALVYIPTSTARCDEIAETLSIDLAPRSVASFHSGLASEKKMEILKGYLEGEIDIIVATTAFGMGVDKADIRTVIHYEISDSLENYAQEAGRGARDGSLDAYCPILFDENDLDRHFSTLNSSKLTIDEINAIFRVLKRHKGKEIVMSAREIAQEAGWDTEESGSGWEEKVKTALLELEREGYLHRGRNRVRFFADAVAVDSFKRLEDALEQGRMKPDEYQPLKSLLSSLLGRGKPASYRIDDAAMILGIPRKDVAAGILRLKELGIVSDDRESSLHISRNSCEILRKVIEIEKLLLRIFSAEERGSLSIRYLNEELIEAGIVDENSNYSDTIRELLKMWRSKKSLFHFSRVDRINDIWFYEVKDRLRLQETLQKKWTLSSKLCEYLSRKIPDSQSKEAQLVEFSILELSKFASKPVRWIDRALLFMHRIGVLKLAEGRFIYYSPMQIYKSDKFERKRKYTQIEYNKRLKAYYTRKVEAVHIVGEYARRMMNNHSEAANFLKDYFTLSYNRFKRRYRLLKEDISRPMTKARYEKIFGSLSDAQKRIIEEREHRAIMVLAGPGSGKTSVLVHKIASLILKEDVKPEAFLMLTFSHSAAAEFRARLEKLIASTARDVEIRTFHGFALSLIARSVGENDSGVLERAISIAAEQIEKGMVKVPFKAVLMLDEFQDINEDAFSLIKALYRAQDSNMRIIAVGDDDQCILKSVNGADISFFKRFEEEFSDEEGGVAHFYLVENYRSCPKILDTAEVILGHLESRMKDRRLVAMKRRDCPKVKIVYSESPYLSVVASELFAPPVDSDFSSAFLAFSNKETASIYSELFEKGLKPSFIGQRKGYRLKNLAEIHDFTLYLRSICRDGSEFDRADIQKALEYMERKFRNSKRLDTLHAVIDTFVDEFERFFFTLWRNYLEELDFSEFEKMGRVVCTTMHKSKGREFERVVVVVHRRESMDDEWLRLLFVAFTRAKKELMIVTDDPLLLKWLEDANTLFKKSVSIERDRARHPPPSGKILLMGLADVVLSVSPYSYIEEASRPVAGDSCDIDTTLVPYHITYRGTKVERLSKSFCRVLEKEMNEGWRIEAVEVDSVVFWHDPKRDIELPHLLAKVTLARVRRR